MVLVPVDSPVTTPDVLMVAVVVLATLHVPPVAVLLIVMVAPTQTTVGPERVPASGAGFTVTTLVATCVPQALIMVYLMVSTPADTPLTTPVVFTDAMAGNTVLHVPPVVALLSVMVALAQTVDGPVMAEIPLLLTVTT